MRKGYPVTHKLPLLIRSSLKKVSDGTIVVSSVWKFLRFQSKWRLKYFSIVKRNKVTKICIWAPYSIGDTIQNQAVAKTAKAVFPHAKITFACANFRFSIELAKRMPCYDTILASKENTFPQFYKNYHKQFDLTLSPITKVFTKRLKPKPLISELCSGVGLPIIENIDFDYNFNQKELDYASKIRTRHGEYLVFHTDCGKFTSSAEYSEKRNWIDVYWQQLIDMQEMPVILIGKATDRYSNCIDLRNRTTIHEAAAIIKFSKLFVGVVSGPFWFTTVFKKRAIVINGGFEPPILTKHSKSYHIFSEIECSPCLDPTTPCSCNMKCMRLITPAIINKNIREVISSQVSAII